MNSQGQTRIQQRPTSHTHRIPAPVPAIRTQEKPETPAPLLASLAAFCILLFFSGCSSIGYSIDLYPAYRGTSGQIVRNQNEIATVLLGHGVTAESIDNRKEPGWAASANPFARTLIAIDLPPGRHIFILSSLARNGGKEIVPPTTFVVNLQPGKVYLTRFNTLDSNTSGRRNGHWKNGIFYADNELADSMRDTTVLKVAWFLEENFPSFLKDGITRVRTSTQEPLPERVIHSQKMFSISEVYRHIQPNVERQKLEWNNPFVIQ